MLDDNRVNREDLIMKKAMEVFSDEGIKFFGINVKVKEVSQTELVVLQIRNLHMDYTYLIYDDTYIHIEFQTTDKKEHDLRKFRSYEALLGMETSKDVTIYVVYSDNIQNPCAILNSGINIFRIIPISLAKKMVI